MTRITRKDLTQWAADAGVAVETAEKLFNLAGHEIEPEPDEIALLVRQIGASLSDAFYRDEAVLDWQEGRYDTSARAKSIRAGIEAGREYERRRILGDVTVQFDGCDVKVTIPGTSFKHYPVYGAVMKPLLRRLAGAE